MLYGTSRDHGHGERKRANQRGGKKLMKRGAKEESKIMAIVLSGSEIKTIVLTDRSGLFDLMGNFVSPLILS